ncbi:VOC family protein [Dermatobacter hominis]|uniref:VOC family protein n=1 Tax=Dermatobacter hominis TaxID=2884263 RepID=UPI001D114559|nr:VOC family protein [Dermatobacter hominis]UDY36108.1 VOC family protein [Dermatobacter hominis]
MSEQQPAVRVTGMDHVVLVVEDVERSVAWYRDELGIPTERLEEWRAGEVLFPSLRLDATTLIDLLPGTPAGRNVDHVALTVDDVDLEAVAASGRFDVVAGPADLFGARGQGIGLYVRDPDGHVVELRTYA